MTETEIKARELVELYKPYTYHGQEFTSMEEDAENCLMNAKQCALIAVDLMLNEYKELNERPEKINHFVKRPEYWQSVCAEIEKL